MQNGALSVRCGHISLVTMHTMYRACVHRKGNTMAKIIYRKWKCLGCGYTVEGAMTYYYHRKAWDSNHIAYHNERVSK